ncbi:MAG: fructosamine kinase family protein [Bacteroidetes bacterium]|nr:fructosamine kinase family protein [Bacteroidota bacterium]
MQPPQPVLDQCLEDRANFISFTPANGGCINNGGRLHTSRGDFFLKWNNHNALELMFEREARGLALLREKSKLSVPEVIKHGQTDQYVFLLLEYVNRGNKLPNFFQDFAQKLADQHRVTQPQFGLDHDNFIGSLAQSNSLHDDWIGFFINERIQPQLKMAVDSSRLDVSVVGDFDRLFTKLPGIFPKEPPALLHGDLWSGNYMTAENGLSCVYDPAVYFGHREAEISFTMMFGGYDRKFYKGYQDHFPMQPEFEERSEIYNLYPALVHINLFGTAYINLVSTVLARF